LVWAIDHRIGMIADDFDFAISDTGTWGRASIGAGQTTRDVSHAITRERDAVNRVGITLFGFVEYDDVFPDCSRHRTEFCIEIWRGKGIDINNYTSARHNGAD